MGDANESHVTNKKRLPTERRQILVKYYLQLEGWGASKIAKAITNKEKIKVDRKTVSEDLILISGENDIWAQNQVSIAWMSKVRDMHHDTITEEAQLKKSLDDHYQYFRILYLPKQERPNNYDELLLSYEQSKLTHKEFLAIDKALNDKRRLLMEIMERKVLYQKSKEYAKFFIEQTGGIELEEK